MKLNDLKPLEKEKYSQIQPGFSFATLVPLIPSIVQGAISILGLFKTFTSNSGSVKGKDQEFKWDNTVKKTSNVIENYLLF
ncbi:MULTISPECIES: hypothetical protein [unclassified Mycoplasma]|uniref:hypothetical protein n=1 Tax=unclassified Mycoplasma TaxID=2683645 RepID=UPI002B1CF00D|nr:MULTISPECIES: hypothetical protein [unclassified Mycoplasma]MEA4162853.1 hypothetical protein [Mycoplasma sp. 4404]MEA4333803.1 hypothetical protein [Mycoplasma sp. 1232]